MKLIVGLGNPGREYRNHRHNIGFLSIDDIAAHLDIEIRKRKFNARYALYKYKGQHVIFLKPLTFMNLSGEAVKRFVTFFNLSFDNVLVIVDDVHLPFGKIRIRKQGSAGGHNGIQSIIDALGTNQFVRLRIGVDKPKQDGPLQSYVLSNFSYAEKKELPAVFELVHSACLCWLDNGIVTTMQKFN